MTRTRLFSLRLIATLTALLLAFIVVRLLWYPSGYFQIFGVDKQFAVLAAVAVIIGPGLSALVFKPGKKGLKTDLILLAGIETVVLAWGMYALHAKQPIYAVFAVDRFEAVTAREINPGMFHFPDLVGRSGLGPRLVYAKLPTEPAAMNRLIDETVVQGMADIDRRPEFWQPYPQGIGKLKEIARPLHDLLEVDDARSTAIQNWLDKNALVGENYLFLPIRGARADGTMILHADVGYPVEVLPIDTW